MNGIIVSSLGHLLIAVVIIHERFYCNHRYALRQALLRILSTHAGRIAAWSVDRLFQVCRPSSQLHPPVSLEV